MCRGLMAGQLLVRKSLFRDPYSTLSKLSDKSSDIIRIRKNKVPIETI
jgi:hypothetical protein